MLAFIEIKELCFSYPSERGERRMALDHVNLSIKEGEFVAVLGTNGSGKSTLAKHLNAILLPTTGVCRIAGMDTREAERLWDIRQTVGMVFQNPDNQIIAAIVEDDVAFGPENLGIPSDEIRRRVDEALISVDMASYRGFAPHLLSGGQKQRVAIAGTLAMKTKCLVLDEPTAMLDPIGRKEVLDTVRRLHRESGITVVYITHFMEEAAAAQRVIVMENGKVAEDGSPKEIFSQVDAMRKRGLDVPLAAEVAWKLRKQGIRLPEDIVTNEDLVVALCQ
ncbi:MAG: energy-coupling factor transporter ATPase [Schwartzia sp.]|nr:energy-coupling factor transporter ATPase [Schwartzia sp. (in: firmicutes)]MBP3690941.1 energy-coupling factor transporter ATPase [Schwartzia sp. (in: firmicutes)]